MNSYFFVFIMSKIKLEIIPMLIPFFFINLIKMERNLWIVNVSEIQLFLLFGQFQDYFWWITSNFHRVWRWIVE